jgi:hypothetical protein
MLAKRNRTSDAEIYHGSDTAEINFGIHIYRHFFVDVGA